MFEKYITLYIATNKPTLSELLIDFHCRINLLYQSAMEITFINLFPVMADCFPSLEPFKVSINIAMISVITIGIILGPSERFFKWNVKQSLLQKISAEILSCDPANVIHAPIWLFLYIKRFLSGELSGA